MLRQNQSRPPLLRGAPSSSSLEGLEKTFPKSGRSSPAPSVRSIASSINKPLPIVPPLKTPPVPNPRISTTYTIRQQDEIIQSYFDREPLPTTPSAEFAHSQGKYLTSRAFSEAEATDSSRRIDVPGLRLPGSPYGQNNNLFASSDTMLPIRLAETEPRTSQKSRLQAPPPLQLSSSDTNVNMNLSPYSESSLKSGAYISFTPGTQLDRSPALSNVSSNYGDYPNDAHSIISPQTTIPKSPLWRVSEGGNTLHPEIIQSSNQSDYLASLYRNTLPPAPHRPTERPPDLEIYRSHNMVPKAVQASQTATLIDQPPHENSQSLEIETPISRFSDPSPSTPAGNGPAFTTLRNMAKKRLQWHKESVDEEKKRHKELVEEEKKRQQILATAEQKYPAMASTSAPQRNSSFAKSRSSIQDKFGEMYDTISSMGPHKARTASVQTTWPETYSWTPIDPTSPEILPVTVPDHELAMSPAPDSAYLPDELIHKLFPSSTTHVAQEYDTLSPVSTATTPSSGTPPLRPSRGRNRSIAVPLSPYQLKGAKVFEEELQQRKSLAKHELKKSKARRPCSLRLDDAGPSKRSIDELLTSRRLGKPSPPLAQTSEPSSQPSTSPHTPNPLFQSLKTPKSPKTQLLRLKAKSSQPEEGPGKFSWLYKRRAKKKEEHAERWREETKKTIKVVAGGTLGGVVSAQGPVIGGFQPGEHNDQQNNGNGWL